MTTASTPAWEDRMLTTAELAEILQVRVNTLEHWRSQGRGPEFVRVGRRVRYTRAAVDKWIGQETSRNDQDEA
jgi:hypothetical protein